MIQGSAAASQYPGGAATVPGTGAVTASESGESAIARAVTSGQRAWPQIPLPPEVFTAYVRDLGAAPADLADHGPDLYLACACACGDVTALRLFDQHILRTVVARVRSMAVSAANLEDTLQAVRMELFAARPPRIRSYKCRGGLVRWVQVVTIRALLASARASRESPAPETLLQRLVDDHDHPERAMVRHGFNAELTLALEQGVAALPRRSRTILRLFYLDGLNIDAIGAIYRVHRATVARWLVAIRTELMHGLRASFCLPGKLNSADLRSLALAVADELLLSMGRILRNTEDPEPEPADAGSTAPRPGR